MVVRVATVAFEGIEARPVDVQVQIANGNVVFTVVGLGDKAVAESRERVRAALNASGLAMPAKRITVNLAPADLPKEGSHYDLPIALGIMAAIGAIPADALANYTVLGELALDGTITAVAGVLPAAIAANARGHGLICPNASGPEAAWAGQDIDILAPISLIQLANHFKGTQVMARPGPGSRRTLARSLIFATSKARRVRNARSRLPPPEVIICCSADRRVQENRCSLRGWPQFFHLLPRGSYWRSRSSNPSLAIFREGRSPTAGLFARRTIQPRWPRSSVAELGRGPAKSLLPITAFYFSTNCPNFSLRFWTACASRLRLERLQLPAQTTGSFIRQGFSSSRR